MASIFISLPAIASLERDQVLILEADSAWAFLSVDSDFEVYRASGQELSRDRSPVRGDFLVRILSIHASHLGDSGLDETFLLFEVTVYHLPLSK